MRSTPKGARPAARPALKIRREAMTFAQPFQEYEILDRVGAGAMGTVFKARHKRLNRIVALKVLKPSLARDARYVDRLKREARIVASLNHPNIVTGFDLGEEGGYHYFVMEFVEGKSLRALLVEWGMFAEQYARTVARQVALALDHAWQRGVIHRDIKPGNILIDEAGNVKLTDMGLAKGPADLTLTRDGATVGTPQYISPEQARNPHDVDVRSDLYSLGATLYHMVTGVPPFRGDTMAELITNVLHELPVSPKAINSALSDGMSLVIRKLLAKDLTVRYQTPRDLLDDLDRIEKSLPPQIDPQRLSRQEGERPRWPLRAALAGAALSALAVAWWLGAQRPEPAAAAPSAGEFLARLDAELAAQPTPGARLLHLRTITSVPPGTEIEWQRRERQVYDDLQRAVDAVVDALSGDDREALLAYIHDPAVWPDREQVLRERLQPRLLAQVGFSLGQLVAAVRMVRLEELQADIDGLVAARDRQLLVQCEQFLDHRLPARAEDELLAQDFAAAERVFRAGMRELLNGTSLPLPERLPPALLAKCKELHVRAQQQAMARIDAAERAVSGAMREEVASARAAFTALLAQEPPDVVEAQVQRFRAGFSAHWPTANRFRPGRSPWPEIDREFGELQLAVRAAVERAAEERLLGRLALAWRTFCHGQAADALAVLPDVPATDEARLRRVARHREALAAAAALERALLTAIGRASPPAVAFLRVGATEAIELRLDTRSGGSQLVGAPIGQPPRSVRLTELRFGELFARLASDRVVADMPAAVQHLGAAVFRLAGDDLDGLGGMLAALPEDLRAFLADEVAPLVLRVRGERLESRLDRAEVFARLRQAREAAMAGGGTAELERAIETCRSLAPANERSAAEEAELREAETVSRMGGRRQRLLDELRAAAPRGAGIDVRIDGDGLEAEVTLGPRQLDAAEGWQLVGEGIEFAGGGRKWAELDLQALRGAPGLEPRAQRTVLTLDLVLPPQVVGRRFWAFEFRGIGLLLVAGANDVVAAALADGDVRREDVAHRAFVRATSALGEGRAVAVPGGVHRLVVDVTANSLRTSAIVRVRFDDAELVPPQRRTLDPGRAPSFTVHAQQDLQLRRAVVRADGL
jgi:tRNA A-37 threonylcarbamoyl transferase component Bud32